jgi:CheY-like chemotaxis protein
MATEPVKVVDIPQPGVNLRHVAFIDDDARFLRATKRLAERRNPNIRVHCFECAEDFLHALYELPELSAIVTDLQMPGMTGLDLLCHLSIPVGIPVIIWSAHAGQGETPWYGLPGCAAQVREVKQRYPEGVTFLTKTTQRSMTVFRACMDGLNK